MSKVAILCVCLGLLGAVGCGDDDGGAAGSGGGAGVGGGGDLCQQQLDRARNECQVPEQFLSALSAGAAMTDGGVSNCVGAQLCTANCAAAAQCAELTSLTSPFFTCALGCNQQQNP